VARKPARRSPRREPAPGTGEGAARRLNAPEPTFYLFDGHNLLYAGKFVELDSAALEEAMRELAAIEELAGRAGTYAGLRFSVDTSDPAHGALLQEVQERATQIETTLLFFELEWAALSEGQAEALLADERLEFCAHHLRNVRRYREHLLSEPEEKILAEKSVTGASAWSRLFEELTSAIEVHPEGTRQSDGETISLDVALSRLVLPDRDVTRKLQTVCRIALKLVPQRREGERLQKVLHDPQRDGGAHDLEVAGRSHGDDVGPVPGCMHRAHNGEAVNVGQVQVEQHQIDPGRRLGQLPDRFCPVVGHSAHSKAGDPLDVGQVRVGGHQFVLDDKDSDLAHGATATASGNRTVNTAPTNTVSWTTVSCIPL